MKAIENVDKNTNNMNTESTYMKRKQAILKATKAGSQIPVNTLEE